MKSIALLFLVAITAPLPAAAQNGKAAAGAKLSLTPGMLPLSKPSSHVGDATTLDLRVSILPVLADSPPRPLALSGAIDQTGGVVAAAALPALPAAAAGQGRKPSSEPAPTQPAEKGKDGALDRLLSLFGRGKSGGEDFDGSGAKGSDGAAEKKKGSLEPKIDARAHARGKADAPHTLVVYSDFNCSDSMRSADYETQLLKQYPNDLRIVYKHRPLPMHPGAPIAAAIMEAVAMQAPDKVWDFHRAAFSPQTVMMAMFMGPQVYGQILHGMGLDLKRLQDDANGEEARRRVKEDWAEAESFGFRGTPSFVFDGEPIKGQDSPERMVEAVKKTLDR